jgi:hypothetical protein
VITRVTGIQGLLSLTSKMGNDIARGIVNINNGIANEALGVFSGSTPKDTEALVNTEDVTVIQTGNDVTTIIFADKDYGVYQDRGFRHYRNGNIPAKNFTGKTVDRIEPKYIQRINDLVTRSIRQSLTKG